MIVDTHIQQQIDVPDNTKCINYNYTTPEHGCALVYYCNKVKYHLIEKLIEKLRVTNQTASCKWMGIIIICLVVTATTPGYI